MAAPANALPFLLTGLSAAPMPVLSWGAHLATASVTVTVTVLTTPRLPEPQDSLPPQLRRPFRSTPAASPVSTALPPKRRPALQDCLQEVCG